MAEVTVRSSVVDGVPVCQVETADVVVSATLTFGVGGRDEHLFEQGVLHALEHVVMDRVRRTSVIIDAHVSHSTTAFEVTGRPELVAEHLKRVCQALTEVPVGRLRAEVPILAAELDGAENPAAAVLVARHGYQDHGIEAAEGPGPDGLTEDQLLQAARWFTAGNAFLLLVGPMPEDLRLPLPAGGRVEHVRPVVRRWAAPSAVQVDGPACMASLLLPADRSGLDDVAVELIEARLLEVLRHGDGLTYVVEADVLDDVAVSANGARGSHVIVHAEPMEDKAAECAKAFVRELMTLLRSGPEPAELDQALDRLAERRLGVAATAEAQRVAGIDVLFGLPARGGGAVRPTLDQIREYLLPLGDDVVFVLPEEGVDVAGLRLQPTDVEPSAPSTPPDGTLYRAPGLARLLGSDARSALLCLNDEGVWLRLEGRPVSIAWTEVAGVRLDKEGDGLVFGLNGTAIPIGPTLWRNGAETITAVREHVPHKMVYQASDLLESQSAF